MKMKKLPLTTKFYTNRNQEQKQDHKQPYVPQYKVHGMQPPAQYRGGAVMPNNVVTASSPTNQVNPRIKRPMMNIETPTNPIQNTMSNLNHINVGNNVEHSWSDYEDQQLDPNTPMIDNNEYVSDQAYASMGNTASSLEPTMQGKVTIDTSDLEQYDSSANMSSHSANSSDDLFPIISDLNDEEYLLLVSGVAICSGPVEEIQEQVSALLFGEHELCDGQPIDLNDIIVIKRVQIKTGVFLG